VITEAHRWLVRAATVAVAAVAVAGCGSSNNSSSSSQSSAAAGAATTSAAATSSSAGATTTSSAATGSGAGGAGAQAVTDYQSYIGGKAGKADSSLPPVTIGWINQQGGQQAIGPLATIGAQTAVKYINSELGGVDGHPVQLKTCFITSAEEEGKTCAQQLLADKSVDVIDEGAVAIGIQSFYSTIAGAKPVIVGVAVTPVDSVQKNSVIMFGDVTHVLGPFGTYATQVLHAKTAALIYPNIAGITDGAAAIAASLKQAGVSVKKVAYDESSTDLIGPLTSAGATSADMVIPYSDSSGCVNLAKGLKQLGITDAKKIVSAPLCLNGQVAAGLGGDFPIWTYAIASSLFGDPTDPGMPAYTKAATKLEPAGDLPDPWNIVSFAQVLTTVRFLNEVGYSDLSPAKILAKAKAFTGPVALGAPQLACGKYPSAPAVCNDRAQFFEYHGKHVFKKVAAWLQPPS
jgi:branched-chain amino acid transport system substrate-binding protein